MPGCSKASGMTTIGLPAISGSSALFMPAWLTTASTCAMTASCGSQS